MSKKITFQELIDAIAEESGKSKQFTHDFIKDFVDTVNDGLQQNDSVNVAGFGIFELREMDEREGVNPQTGEKINIPSHKKAIFKPYKNLRELVNAPYEHLESEIIEEEEQEPEKNSQEHDDQNNEDQPQFIPTGPPPSVESESDSDLKSEPDSEPDTETEDDIHPFLLDMDEENDKKESGNAGITPEKDDDAEPQDSHDDTLLEFEGADKDESPEESSEQEAEPNPFDLGEEESEELPFELEDFSEVAEESNEEEKPGTSENIEQEEFDEDIVGITPEVPLSEDVDEMADEEDDIFDTEEPFQLEDEINDTIADPDDEDIEQEEFDEDIVEFSPEDLLSEDVDEMADEEDDIFDIEEPFQLEDEIDDTIEDPDDEEYEMYALPRDEEEVETEEDEEAAGEEQILNDEFSEFSEVEELDETEDETEEPQSTYEPPVFKDRSIKKKRNTGGSMWIIAAAVIIILLATGAWYFLMYNTQGTNQIADTSSASTGITNTQPTSTDGENEGAAKSSSQATDQTVKDKDSAAGNAKTNNSGSASTEASTSKVITHTVQKGETLWSLADFNYQDPYRWPWIYDENKPEIENPNIIKVGQELDIPQPQGQDNSLTDNDSLQVAIAFAETYSWYKERGMKEAKFYLYTAKKYHAKVLDHVSIKVDDDDLAFANQQ